MDVTQAEGTKQHESGRRSLWLGAALLFVASVVVTGVALSMWRPASYPRVKVLPAPASAEFEDSCGRGVERHWVEGTLFWEHQDFVDAVPCRGDSIGD